MGSFKRYRDVAIVVVLLVVPFFFLRANMKKPDNLNAVDRVLLISAPIEFAASSLARGVSGLVSDYVYLVDVKQDNDRLSYENARLRETVHKLESREGENKELRRLLQLKEATASDAYSAQIVGKNFTEFFRVTRVVLDRGSRDIKPHMPVVSPDGVVGAVLHVAGDSVDVQLCVDAAFVLDVENDRTRSRGFIRGTGDPTRYSAKVEMVDARDDVEVGDLLVTSGKGKWFPRGLPVARVTKVIKREIGRDQEVEAEPTVNFSRLDSVLILAMPGELELPDTRPTAAPATSAVPSATATSRGR
jgi:rod shape-determining protein MreC